MLIISSLTYSIVVYDRPGTGGDLSLGNNWGQRYCHGPRETPVYAASPPRIIGSREKTWFTTAAKTSV